MSPDERVIGDETLELAYRIDAVCDAFEEAWRSSETPPSETPRIEAFLDRVAEGERSQLFRELLAVDLEFRVQRNEATTLEQVLQEHPEHADVTIDTFLERTADLKQINPAIGTHDGLNHGQSFGDFQILELIGTGGMGAIYLARQQSVRRLVALKVIHTERLQPQSDGSRSSAIDRFRNEAQAAAQLDHPGIVTVYEVGEANGRHYLAMRYIPGRSLSAQLRQGPLANGTAAGYMENVARAVHAAHVQGVLHRDLKPQNILIDSSTDQPWVADFGLAKILGTAPELTQMGDVMGTPQYMAPEQAHDAASVTAKADVYSIGATLYQLVTGRPPFQAATPLETVRQLIENDPLPPRRLNPSIDLDLETICLKTLAKEPEARYDSAAELADDLRRYLDHKPIRARRIGPLGIAKRWCQRNPAIAVLSLTLSLSVIAALVATTVGFVTTATARKASETGFQDARSTLNKIVTRVREEPQLASPELDSLRVELLTQAMDYYQDFLAQRANDQALREEVAATYYNLGLIQEEITSPSEALTTFGIASKLQRQLVQAEPDNPTRLADLGTTLNASGRVHAKLEAWEQAKEAFQAAVDTRQRALQAAEQARSDVSEYSRLLISSQMNLGIVANRRGEPSEALRYYEMAQEARLELLTASGDDEQLRKDIGLGYYNLGNLALSSERPDDAANFFESAVIQLRDLKPIDDVRYPLAVSLRLLGDLDVDYDLAVQAYQEALTTLEPLVEREPDSRQYAEELARLYMNIGQLEFDAGDDAAAGSAFQVAMDYLQRLVAVDDSVPSLQRNLGVTQIAMAKVHLRQQRLDAAHDLLRDAERRLEALFTTTANESDRALLQQTRALLPP